MDASIRALRDILSHLDDNEREYPIQYASRNFNELEKNFSEFEHKALGIVFALKKFQHYLLCQRFELYTDQQALNYEIILRDPH